MDQESQAITMARCPGTTHSKQVQTKVIKDPQTGIMVRRAVVGQCKISGKTAYDILPSFPLLYDPQHHGILKNLAKIAHAILQQTGEGKYCGGFTINQYQNATTLALLPIVLPTQDCVLLGSVLNLYQQRNAQQKARQLYEAIDAELAQASHEYATVNTVAAVYQAIYFDAELPQFATAYLQAAKVTEATSVHRTNPMFSTRVQPAETRFASPTYDMGNQSEAAYYSAPQPDDQLYAQPSAQQEPFDDGTYGNQLNGKMMDESYGFDPLYAQPCTQQEPFDDGTYGNQLDGRMMDGAHGFDPMYAQAAAQQQPTYDVAKAAKPVQPVYDTGAASQPLQPTYDTGAAAKQPVQPVYDTGAASQPLQPIYDIGASAKQPQQSHYDLGNEGFGFPRSRSGSSASSTNGGYIDVDARSLTGSPNDSLKGGISLSRLTAAIVQQSSQTSPGHSSSSPERSSLNLSSKGRHNRHRPAPEPAEMDI